MRSLVPTARVHGQVLVARDEGELSGALVASPPGRFPLPSAGVVSRLRVVLGQGWSVATRWGEVFVALEALHPIEPHWYLGTLGVAPHKQRRGFGLSLLREWLRAVDRDGVGAYLETDTERNVGFYGSVGFEVEGEIEVLGAPIWRMSRPPAPTGATATH
jgi:ribosomal protein S18 acetylase RimI-like enzyme